MLLTAVSLALGLLGQASEPPYTSFGYRCIQGMPLFEYTLFDSKEHPMCIMTDGEVRWFNDPRNKPIKTAKIEEVPRVDYSAEELKAIEKAEKAHEAMFGDIPPSFFGGAELIERPGRKEFCLTNRDGRFYFYSTEDGKLLRKVDFPMPTHKRGGCMPISISSDNRYAMMNISASEKAFLLDLSEKKVVASWAAPFLSSFCVSFDGKSVLRIIGNKLSRFSTADGKASGPDVKISSDSAGGLVTGNSSNVVAYTLYSKGNYAGQEILNLDTGKTIRVTPDLARFGAFQFTPDDKYLALWTAKYLHFADSSTGKHAFSHIAGFPDVWDNAQHLAFSSDNSKLIFKPSEGLNPTMPYFIFVDFARKQNRNKFDPKYYKPAG